MIIKDSEKKRGTGCFVVSLTGPTASKNEMVSGIDFLISCCCFRGVER
jgi:hypothetical protein